MSFYALSTTLMQGTLRSIQSVKQVWLADDATGKGKITPLRQWWDIITTEGKYMWILCKRVQVLDHT